MRRFPRWAVLTPLALGLLLFLGGCIKRETRSARGVRENVLHLGNGAEPKDLDPNTYQSAIEYTVLSALFEGLVNIANDGETILPGVAERWEVSPDALVYTFHLRRDARWSDGTAVTADDFLYSFRRLFTPSVAAATADMGYAIANSREMVTGKISDPEQLGVRAVNAHLLEVRLEHPAPYILFVLGGAPFHPLPRAVVDRHGGASRPGTAWTRPENIVGNGPFVVKTWRSNSFLSVRKNPHYWDASRVRLSEVRFYPIEDASIEERAFRAGELHVTFALPVSKLSAYAQGEPTMFRVTPLLSSSYLTFNTQRRPFDDARVRRAFSLAIDRERVVPAVLMQSATPGYSITRPNTGGYTPPRLTGCDPDLARRLLVEAGYAGGVGLPQVEFLMGTDTKLGEALQRAWQKELGVTVQLAAQDGKTAIGNRNSGNFQVALGGYFYGMQSPAFILNIARGDSAPNTARWTNAEFDRAMAAANHSRHEAERHAAFDTMEHLINEEAPFAPLYHENKCSLVSANVRGWRDNPLYAIDWRELFLSAAP